MRWTDSLNLPRKPPKLSLNKIRIVGYYVAFKNRVMSYKQFHHQKLWFGWPGHTMLIHRFKYLLHFWLYFTIFTHLRLWPEPCPFLFVSFSAQSDCLHPRGLRCCFSGAAKSGEAQDIKSIKSNYTSGVFSRAKYGWSGYVLIREIAEVHKIDLLISILDFHFLTLYSWIPSSMR